MEKNEAFKGVLKVPLIKTITDAFRELDSESFNIKKWAEFQELLKVNLAQCNSGKASPNYQITSCIRISYN